MMRFGRRGVKTDYRTLRLAKYLAVDLPAPPPKVDNFDRAMKTVADSDFTDLFPMDYNDQLGCCTIAGLGHAMTLYRGMAGTGFIPAADDIKALYLSLSGGQDTGLYCLDVLNYAKANDTLGGQKVLAFAGIDPTNHTHVKQAIQLFGCVYLGFRCQASVVDDFQARKPWDASGDMTSNGHCVAAGAYDDTTGLIRMATWGNWQDGTWAWWTECVDEAFVILPQEASDPDFTPGVNLAALQADLAAIRAS